VQTEEPQDLRGGGREEKKPQITQKQEQMEIIPTIKVEFQKYST
jgi:hypothetical protein